MAKAKNERCFPGFSRCVAQPPFRRKFGAAIGIPPTNPTVWARVTVHGLRAEMNDRCRVFRVPDDILGDQVFGAANLRRRAAGERTVNDDVAVAQQTRGIRRIGNPAVAARNTLPAQKRGATAISANRNQFDVLARC